MEHLTRILATSAIPAFVILSLPDTAAGSYYLDPGTGSIIIQVLIGALAGGLIALKIFWGRISSLFKKLFYRGRKRAKD